MIKKTTIDKSNNKGIIISNRLIVYLNIYHASKSEQIIRVLRGERRSIPLRRQKFIFYGASIQ